MNEIVLPLRQWAAWTAGASTAEEWSNLLAGDFRAERNELPNSAHIPAMMRRRCSRFTKAAIAVAYQCVSNDELSHVRTVFSSRHGEAEVTLNLLRQLACAEPLSPMGFGLSVHNAGSGILSIQTRNTLCSTAIAARLRSVTSGLLEVATLLHEDSECPVLLLVADETLPKEFRRSPDEWHPYYSAAFLFGSGDKSQIGVSISRASNPASSEEGLHCFEFIRWLLSSESALSVTERGQLFQLTKSMSLGARFREDAKSG